jgi:hypothetical protein
LEIAVEQGSRNWLEIKHVVSAADFRGGDSAQTRARRGFCIASGIVVVVESAVGESQLEMEDADMGVWRKRS